ncbi:protein PHLOEM PROTEIN 2-LIKE A9-like [Tasmannia lanceolata]|uniref:protein PHLOEM PROTEIN 2-LIKE A9-like n=1 Tax=Tasmannia lanceolata TaxID=3420 RepID=UPI004063B061
MASPSHYKAVINTDTFIEEKDGSFTFKPQALDIIWGKDSRYWRFPPNATGSVELLQVCWLEVSGSIPIQKMQKEREYQVKFKVEMKPDAFGWSGSPVYLMAKVGKGDFNWKRANLNSKGTEPFSIPDDLKFKVPSGATNDNNDKISFGLYEIWKGRWKGGLLIHEVVISPV